MAMMRADDVTAGQMFNPPRSTASSDIIESDLHSSGYEAGARHDQDEFTLTDYAGLLESLGTSPRLKQFPDDKQATTST